MSFAFRTKAETLAALAVRVSSARVLPLIHVSVAEWKADRDDVLARIKAEDWAQAPLIVRSSAAGEDSAQASQAGKYLSLADTSLSGLAEAVEAVIAAYGRPDATQDHADRVLIQPLLPDVACSGVAFTRDPSTGSPYLVVTGHDGADTAMVTGGGDGRLWRHYHWRDGPAPNDERVAALLALSRDLMALCGRDALDMEFAFTGDGTLWLLQVRPLALAVPPVDDAEHAKRVYAILRKVAQSMRPHPLLPGSRTAFGIMPDWNPAEMIGVRPTPLALSLYRELVTDSIWAYQRHNYGYRNLRSFPLMLSFHGLPYIDVRVSFNSFIPRDIEDGLAEKLVDHYLERLLVSPSFHDKVESEIVFSVYTFDLPKRLEALSGHGFTAAERDTLAESLRRLTNTVINRQTGLWQSDSQKLAILEERRDKILASGMTAAEKIYWLLEDVKRYGTLPFAGLARAGFMAVQMLKSLVAAEVFSQEDYNAFLGSLTTVGSELAQDSATLDRDAFLDKYGHLRPGTYDIRSLRYDEAPDLYGIADKETHPASPRPRFGLSLPQMRRIEALLAEHRLDNDVVGLFDFFQAAIEGRERAKFIFTRSLSDALTLLAEMGAPHAFDRDDMAMADIALIRELQTSSEVEAEALARSIACGRERWAVAQTLVLPALIAGPGDVWSFRMLETEPNFITLGGVTAPVRSVSDPDLAGAIVCIPGADPGYDWIFARGIGGLVTAFGGANSHMAIRAAELGLPAVIGAGEMNYQRWSSAATLRLDCANRKVEVIR